MDHRHAKSNSDHFLEHCLECQFGQSGQEVVLASAHDRKSSRQLAAQFVNQMIAAAFEISGERLLHNDRGVVRINRPRQISMYLMNTALSLKFTEIAEFYDKDRTTVSHACKVIEELRDDVEFDDRISEFENTIRTVLELTCNEQVRHEYVGI